jgi:photosystem II stability/assembly factor-like uncharacterized protein
LAPTVTTDAASDFSPTGAVLNATIADTGGSTPSVRGFQYGLTSSYGTTTTDAGSTLVGAGKRNWNAIAMSPDGSKMAATTGGNGINTDFIYASTDGGATWTALTAAGKRVWMAIDISSDGTKLIAVDHFDTFTSTDSGATWTQHRVLGSAHDFRAAAISPDGSVLAVADNDGQNWTGTVLGKIYTSTDGGTTWTQQTGAGTGYWSQLRFSPDGTRLIAGAGAYYAYVYNEQYNYLWTGSTSDGGASWAWTRQDGAGQHNWISAAFFSADGSRIATADRNTGSIYTSTDAGATWQTDNSLGARGWTAVAASPDGSTLAIASYDGYLYTGSSADGGVSWNWTLKSGTWNVPHWNAAALSSDGSKLVAAPIGADLRISPAALQPIPAGPFSAAISGLACTTTYHFRPYATNANGTSFGPDGTFTTSACPTNPQPLLTTPAATDLRQDMIDGIDMRIAGFSTSPSSFRSLWTTRGNGTDGWQYNATTLWSNQGAHALDFTGASPWNSTMGYAGAGTLISPRHLLFANHFTPAAGSAMAFVDHDNRVITRTLVNTRRIGSTDITIGVLDADVPNSIAHYPLLSYADIRRYVVDTRIPIIRFNSSDTVFIQDISNIADGSISTTASFGIRAPYTSSAMVGGDSGNPNFAVIGDRLILLGAHYTANSFPNTGNYIAEINAAMTTLGGGYQVTQLDLSHFVQYVPPAIPNQSMNVIEQVAAGTVVGTVRVNGVNGMSTLHSFQITAGDPNNAFSINSNTGAITVDKPALLDSQLVQSFTLTVSVQDSTSPPTLATGTVSVSVTYDPQIPHPPVAVHGVYAWTERTNSGVRGWSNIAASGQGSELVAVDADAGAVWTSPDSGATWAQQTALGAGGYWTADLSSDGNHLVAADYYSAIWTANTADGGVTWAWTQRSVPNHSWYAVAISANGARIVAIATDGAIFTSADGGATWTERTIPGKDGWSSVVSSADGTTLATISYNGDIATSTDAGATWADRTLAGYHNWASIAGSADGTKLAAVEYGGYIHTSDDAGLTWTPRTSAGSRNWYDIAVSADGSRLAAAAYGGYIHASTDSGATWAAQTGTGARPWTAIAFASNGGKLAAVAYGEYVWTGALTPSATTEDASSLFSTGAFLNGSLQEIGVSPVTRRGFQYGPTINYGTTTTENGSFDIGFFSASIGGISCGTTYHVRSYATNAAGTTYGADRTFSLPCPAILTYTAGVNGSIAGTSPQTVEIGQDGTAVTAIPNAGYRFVSWSDGSTANPRMDSSVSANVSVTASFEPVPPNDPNPPNGESPNADVPLPPWATGLLLLLFGSLLRRSSGSSGNRLFNRHV